MLLRDLWQHQGSPAPPPLVLNMPAPPWELKLAKLLPPPPEPRLAAASPAALEAAAASAAAAAAASAAADGLGCLTGILKERPAAAAGVVENLLRNLRA